MIALLTAALIAVDGDTILKGDQLIRAAGYDACEIHEEPCGPLAKAIVQQAIDSGSFAMIRVICENGAWMHDLTPAKRPLAYFQIFNQDLGQTLIDLGLAEDFNNGEPLGGCE